MTDKITTTSFEAYLLLPERIVWPIRMLAWIYPFWALLIELASRPVKARVPRFGRIEGGC